MTNSFFYFAYGSNMLSARLRERCPSAVLTGLARAAGHRLEFSKRSKDGSGKATLIPDAGSSGVLGVVFSIANSELFGLDRAEGASGSKPGYVRTDCFDVMLLADGKVLQASTYIASKYEPNLVPYDWYLALVIAGALENRFDQADLDRLRQTPWLDDRCEIRETRISALSALPPGWRGLLASGEL